MPLTRPRLAQVQTSVTKIDDPLIELNAALSGANTDDLGILINRGSTGNNVGIIWDRSAQAFAFISTTADSDSTGDMVIADHADLQAKSITADNISTANFDLPATDGSAGQVLTTDGLGVVTWETATGTTDHTALSNIGTNTHAQIDTHIADSTLHFTQAAISITESQISDLQSYLLPSDKGVANGIASLDAGAKIPSAQLPALALTDVFTVANEAAQLALTAQEGDIAIRTDQNKTYAHNGGAAGTMADWSELLAPTGAVTSVDGNTGAVTAAQLLTSIKTVDGTGSGLDADLLDGLNSDAFVAVTGDSMTGNLIMSSAFLGFSGSIATPTHAASIFRPVDNTLAFGTANTERMRVNSTGAVSIGTSVANYKLNIYNSTNPELQLISSTTGTTASDGVRFGLNGSDVFLWNSENADVYFGTNSNERMRINSIGRVGIGTSSPGNRFDVFDNEGDNWTARFRDTAASPLGVNIDFNGGTPNDSAHQFLYCTDTTNLKFEIRSNSDLYNRTGVYGTFSDIKLKQDIVDASSQWDDIKNLQVRNYRLIDDVQADANAEHKIGLVAQEVELVSPGLVSDSPDLDEDRNDLGTVTKSVKYSILYMKAIKALQEAQLRIETLETEKDALKALLVTKGVITQAEADSL